MKDYIIYDSNYIKLQTMQIKSIMTEGRAIVTYEKGDREGQDPGTSDILETSGNNRVIHYLDYSCFFKKKTKTYQIAHFNM